MVRGFKEAFEKGGGKVTKELNLPFPNVEFQALLTEIAAAKPDAVFSFFAGGGAVKFVKDYAAAGLKKSIPLYGTGFLTDGTLEAQGEAAEGVQTTLHYADGLNTPRDNAFRLAYAKSYKLQPDVYAVQGYDAAQILGSGLAAVKGDVGKKAEFIAAAQKATHRQPARRVHAVAGAQPGAGHLPAPGGRPRRTRSSAWPARPSPTRRAVARCSRGPGGRAARQCHGPCHLPHPVPERAAVRAAAVSGGLGADADLRHHGRHQPGARQLLHDRRLHGLSRWRRSVGATFGGGFFATLAVGLVLAVLLGYVLEWAFFSFLYEREHLQQVLMTYGLILVFEELRSLLVGDDVHGVRRPPWLAGTLPLGETDDLSGVPAVHLRRVPGAGRWACTSSSRARGWA